MPENLDESIFALVSRLIIGPVSMVGNGLIVIIALKFRNFRSAHCNRLIGLLAAGEFLMGVGMLIRVFVSVYNSANHIIVYDRYFCNLIGIPQIFSISFGQIILLSMSIDRFTAVFRPMKYFKDDFTNLTRIIFAIALCVGSFFCFLSLYKVDNTQPPPQCSTGAGASDRFQKVWIVFGNLTAFLIFAIYSITLYFLIKRTRSYASALLEILTLQRQVFVSISFILLSYFIFLCLPLFTITVATFSKSYTAINLGNASLLINGGSGLNSCVGIFIYLAKHQKLRENFIKLLPNSIQDRYTKNRVVSIISNNNRVFSLRKSSK